MTTVKRLCGSCLAIAVLGYVAAQLGFGPVSLFVRHFDGWATNIALLIAYAMTAFGLIGFLWYGVAWLRGSK